MKGICLQFTCLSYGVQTSVFTVHLILLPQNPSCVLEWIVVLSAVLMLKLSGVILFFLLLHIESCDSCGRFSHGWVAHLMNIVRQTFLLNTLYRLLQSTSII